MVYKDKLWHRIYQMITFLPKYIQNALTAVNMQHLYEIRMRAEMPITVNYNGKYRYLASIGVTDKKEKALTCTIKDIEESVYRAGEYSVYSVEEQIKQGFLTAKHGERIGIAGHFVFEKGQAVTVRNFSSLCIRVPHEVIGCAKDIYTRVFVNGLRHLLIVSRAGQGKTTILRDLSRLLSENAGCNVLICDERGEIAEGNIGRTTDVFSFADKKSALEIGVRVMRPDIIITDELSVADYPSVLRAKKSGVYIIASMHASKIGEIPKEILDEFDAVVLLDSFNIGKVSEIFLMNK